MAFRLVSSGGIVADPAVVNMPASGIIRAGGIVCRNLVEGLGDATLGQLVSAPVAASATEGATTTNIVGVSLDYVQGASDTYVKVIPFAPGQIWEVDCISAVTTSNLFLRHQLGSTSGLIRNVTRMSETTSVGIFLALAISGATTGSGKLLGTFLQRVPVMGKDGVTPTT